MHQRHRKLQSLKKLKLEKILKRKNPYLFKAKNVAPQDLTKGILDAHLSSQEETVFGEFLEGLAIFVCNEVWGGRKSSAEGIDLEFERDKKLYIVSVKSGPNWGNSSQIQRMKDNFRKAQRILRTSHASAPNIIAVALRPFLSIKNPNKGVNNIVPRGRYDVIFPLSISLKPNLSAKKSGAKAKKGKTAE